MSRFAVEKIEIPVLITHVDGSTVGGTLFLAPYSKTHGGRQTVTELLEESRAFLPLKTDRGDLLLVGTEGISILKAERPPDEVVEFVRRVPMRARLAGGGKLDGELIVPEGDAAFRVSDYLNSPTQWLRVEHGESDCWVRKSTVLEVRI